MPLYVVIFDGLCIILFLMSFLMGLYIATIKRDNSLIDRHAVGWFFFTFGLLFTHELIGHLYREEKKKER